MANSLVEESGVMKQVLAYIFNRQPDGSMDASRIVDRGLYNAKDQDILNAAAAKIHDQRLAWGEKLVDNSYILVLDFWNLSKDHSQSAGAGYAFRFTRMFELTPYAVVGMDWLAVRKESFAANGSFFFEPGARFAVNYYPFSVYAKAFFDILSGENHNTGRLESPHKSRLGLGLGIRWSF